MNLKKYLKTMNLEARTLKITNAIKGQVCAEYVILFAVIAVIVLPFIGPNFWGAIKEMTAEFFNEILSAIYGGI